MNGEVIIDIYMANNKGVYTCVTEPSLQIQGGGGSTETPGTERGEGVIAMTTTGAQYALAASAGAGNGGGAPTAVGVDIKPSVVALTTTSSGNSTTCQAQSNRGQQVITVVTSPDPSSPNNLQPIQVCTM